MPPENDGAMFKNYNLEKKIDVLFFGQVRADRRDFIDFLIALINLSYNV